MSLGMLRYLKLFRALVFGLIIMVLIKPERKLILFGLAWFWITILPALPLISHFLTYYLFLPVVGLSLVIGTVFARLYDVLSRIHKAVAFASILAIFGGLLYVTSYSIRTHIERNSLLGGSAESAFNTLQDLKRLYPNLPVGARLYFVDANEIVSWNHDSGSLIRMAYGTDQISTLYQSLNDLLSSDGGNTLVFRVHNGRLIDETSRSAPIQPAT